VHGTRIPPHTYTHTPRLHGHDAAAIPHRGATATTTCHHATRVRGRLSSRPTGAVPTFRQSSTSSVVLPRCEPAPTRRNMPSPRMLCAAVANVVEPGAQMTARYSIAATVVALHGRCDRVRSHRRRFNRGAALLWLRDRRRGREERSASRYFVRTSVHLEDGAAYVASSGSQAWVSAPRRVASLACSRCVRIF
jgi:hypothetical protein